MFSNIKNKFSKLTPEIVVLLEWSIEMVELKVGVKEKQVQAQGLGLWCYKCVSTHPGCGKDFDWRWHWSYTCPDPNDKCVKIVERKGAEEIITRDCLSSIQGIRRDIPADIYEGCRPAARDIRLAQYVFNDIDELDIKRNHYDNTTFCFCDFDQFCNSVGKPAIPAMMMIISIVAFAFNWLHF
uniref:EOG090X0I2F n=2 Tax=Daphnia lumholtzi TaxID=42856 RepID=A0A4Y7MHG5_9CRUS|nr:EOG090X0I2F [Daphnia lumholtzi]